MNDVKDIRQYVETIERYTPDMPAEQLLARLTRIYSKQGFERVREAARIELEQP